MYCPFIKNNCNSDCVFCGNNNTCNLLTTLKNIEINTGSDQTESWYINDKLKEVSNKLDSIIKKIEQSAD